MRSEEPPPRKSLFKFTNSKEAAEFNPKILKSCNYDYEKFLSKQKNTTKNWNRIKLFLTEGSDTSLKNLQENILKDDCVSNLERGNHKSASK